MIGVDRSALLLQFLNVFYFLLDLKVFERFSLLWGLKSGLPTFYLALAIRATYTNWWRALRQLGSARRYCVTNRGILLRVVLFSVLEHGFAIWEIRELNKQPRERRQQNPQICIFDNEKQYFCTLCTCIFHLLTFWRHSRSFYDVKLPVLQLCGRRDRMMVNG